jgi:hypothetical protein
MTGFRGLLLFIFILVAGFLITPITHEYFSHEYFCGCAKSKNDIRKSEVPYNATYNNMSADLKNDDLGLNRFFNFGQFYAKFFPRTKKIVNNYYKVPLVI